MTRTTDTAALGTVQSTTAGPQERRLPRWAVPLLAMVGGLIVWMTGVALGVGDVIVDTGGAMQQVSAVSVAVAGLIAGLAGWGVRALIGKLAGNARRGQVIWLVLSGLVLLISLMGVMGATTPGAMLVLLSEHVAVGLVVMLGLRR